MLVYRNGICKPGPSTYILCAVEGFDACGCRSQHWHGRMLERPLQILALSRDEIIDCSSNLLWSEKSTSFLGKQQTYTWYYNSSIRHKMRTLGLETESGMETHFPRIHTKHRSSFCLNSQKEDLYVFPGGNLSYSETTVTGSPGHVHRLLLHFGLSSHRRVKGSPEHKSCTI